MPGKMRWNSAAPPRGSLDSGDLAAVPAYKMALEGVGHDPQGRITAAAIDARVQAWRALGIARMVVPCQVRHGNAPLVGAVVTFVPAAFLRPQMKTGSGTTNVAGLAMISMEGADPPGMPPGFYSIQVTKPGENIPARYNTATIFFGPRSLPTARG